MIRETLVRFPDGAFFQRHFPKCLSSLKEYKEGDVKESMRKAYLKIDEMMESPQYREELLELMRSAFSR